MTFDAYCIGEIVRILMLSPIFLNVPCYTVQGTVMKSLR